MLGVGNRFAGAVVPIEAPEGMLARRFTGYLSIELMLRALSELHPLLADDETQRVVILEGLTITGFEPGMPIRAVNWFAAAPPHLRVALSVTTSPVLVATTRASRLLLPNLHVDALPTVGDAFVVADEHAQLRRRATTGVQRRVGVQTPATGLTRTKQTG